MSIRERVSAMKNDELTSIRTMRLASDYAHTTYFDVWNKVQDKRLDALESGPNFFQVILTLAVAGVAGRIVAGLASRVLDRVLASRHAYVEVILEGRIPKSNQAALAKKLKKRGHKVSNKKKKVSFKHQLVLKEKEYEGFLLTWVPDFFGSRFDELIQEKLSDPPIAKKVSFSVADFFSSINAWIEAQELTTISIHDTYMNAIADGNAATVEEALERWSSAAAETSKDVGDEVWDLLSAEPILAKRLDIEASSLGQVLSIVLIVLFFGPVQKGIGRQIHTKPEKVTQFDETLRQGGSSRGITTEFIRQPFALIVDGMQDFVDIWTATLWDPDKKPHGTTFLQSAKGQKGAARLRLIQHLARVEQEIQTNSLPNFGLRLPAKSIIPRSKKAQPG